MTVDQTPSALSYERLYPFEGEPVEDLTAPLSASIEQLSQQVSVLASDLAALGSEVAELRSHQEASLTHKDLLGYLGGGGGLGAAVWGGLAVRRRRASQSTAS